MVDDALIKKRQPWLAGLLTFLTLGLGQWYNGQPKKAILFHIGFFLAIFFLTRLGVLQTFSGLLIFLTVAGGLFLAILIEAVVGAWRRGEMELRPYQRWYIYLILIIVVQGTYLKLDDWMTTDLFGIKAYQIPSESMKPTLVAGDFVMADTQCYQEHDPHNGDLAFLKFSHDDDKIYVKRIIAIPGDTLTIVNKQVYLNTQPLDEPYRVLSETSHLLLDNVDWQIIPPNRYYVLGDNRDNSVDSRLMGLVERNRILGKALYIYYADDWDRIGTPLQ